MSADSPPYISFDRVADTYEATRYIPPEILKRAVAAILKDGGFGRGSRFLDAGVGTGRFLRHLNGGGLTVVGIDISREMLSRAGSPTHKPHLVRADLRSLPFPTASFDGALVVHVLHLISDWTAVIQELRRVLRPGAPCYFGVETGKQFPSRSIYFQAAADRGLSRSNIGAASLDEILDHVRYRGAIAREVEGSPFQWTARTTVRAMIETMRANPFSHMWHLDGEVYESLVAEVERNILDSNADVEVVEEAPAGFALWRVQWDGPSNDPAA